LTLRTGGEPEIELPGGTHGPVVRVGDTVRRRAAQPAVHALLKHFETLEFRGAPRFLGMDEEGREILSFLPGEVALHRDGHPLPSYARSDETLDQVGRLMREMHDATVEFQRPPNAEWALLDGAPADGDVLCHNDIAPWNTVFVDGKAVAFIDWDGAAPAPRMWDVAYAAYRFVPFIPDDICAIIGWKEAPDRLRRMTLLCDAYGIESDAVLETINHRIKLMIAKGDSASATGDPRFGERWLNVMRKRLLRDLEFVRSFS
jgi:Ser/Thr protein kinase RdoA (MazF antagonist)